MSQILNSYVAESLKPSTRWVVVANRSGARLFESPGPGRRLRLIREIPNPSGRLHERDEISDRPGRIFGNGPRRYGFSRRNTPTDNAAVHFARVLANVLEDGRARSLYTELVLVAEPRFLGKLRAAVSRQTSRLVSVTVEKELNSFPRDDLERLLAGAKG